MSDLVELLTAIRSHYLGLFCEALDALRAEKRTFIVEPALLDAQGDVVREGLLDTGARCDVLVMVGDTLTPTTLSADRMLQFEPASFTGADLTVVISPFTWDNARIAIDCEAQAAAKVLADWFEEAFSERGSANNQSLLGVAHEISDPLVEGATSIALIDFGSVDIALVIDLFDRLGAAGASRVELSLPEV